MIYAFHLLASFVVASIAFLYPLNALSLMLAFASLVLSFVNKGDQDMDKKIATVSQGICGTERPDLVRGCMEQMQLRKCKIRFPPGFDAPPSHHFIGQRFLRGPLSSLFSPCFSEELPFILRGADGQQVPLVAALVEADTTLRVADELVLRFLQLEVVHVELLIHAAAVEDELMRRDGEERACQLGDAGEHEVLQIL